MGITCPVFLVNAFTSRAFTGNPAGVCLLRQSIEDSLMQNIATELGYAETAFVLYKEKTPILRWFTPQVEIDLCGHATLACSHVLFSKEYFDESGVYQSKSGSLQVRRIGGSIVISFPRKDVEPVEDDVNLRQILGVKRSVPIFRVADDTFATRLLLLPCVEDLQKVQPEFERLRSLRKAVIITAKSEESIQGKEIDFVSRFFAPHVGINEDSVTGRAHCSLAPFWSQRLGKRKLWGYQLSKRGGWVGMEVKDSAVMLQGNCVTLFEGSFVVPDK